MLPMPFVAPHGPITHGILACVMYYTHTVFVFVMYYIHGVLLRNSSTLVLGWIPRVCHLTTLRFLCHL